MNEWFFVVPYSLSILILLLIIWGFTFGDWKDGDM